MSSPIYSTAELIEILAAEQRACMGGKRLHLAVNQPKTTPLIERFIEPIGLQKFTAYDNFRQTIHRYQREHQVSGIVWQELTVGAHRIRLPKVHEQLVALTQDLRILRAFKPEMLAFWGLVTADMVMFVSVQRGLGFEPIGPAALDRSIGRSEWTSLSHQGQRQQLELILQLGWGQPEVARYRRGFPESGSEFVHAVYPGQQPLG
jgi:hypothetical protein